MASDQRSPATRTLTDKQRALVEAIVTAAEAGVELTREDAGRLAGYGTGEVARASASRTLALPYVRDALVERMRDLAVMDAPAAMATLRHVRRTGTTGHRLTAAIETLKLAGVGGGEGMGGAGVVINLVLPASIATPLTQRHVIDAQAIDVTRDREGEHRLDEAGGVRKRAATPPRGAKGKAAKKGAGGQKRRAKAVARPPRTIFSSKRVVSDGGTDG